MASLAVGGWAGPGGVGSLWRCGSVSCFSFRGGGSLPILGGESVGKEPPAAAAAEADSLSLSLFPFCFLLFFFPFSSLFLFFSHSHQATGYHSPPNSRGRANGGGAELFGALVFVFWCFFLSVF